MTEDLVPQEAQFLLEIGRIVDSSWSLRDRRKNEVMKGSEWVGGETRTTCL